MSSGVWTFPDVVEQAEGVHVESSLYWQFTKDEEESRLGRALAKLETAPQHLVVEDLQWFHICWPYRES